MRKKFNQQLSLGVTPISEVKIDQKSRHQLAPILQALKYLFVTHKLNEEIFTLLDEKILGEKKKTGRLGMSLWEILVLGATKLGLNVDYDFLHDQANHHDALRGILGVSKSDFTKGKEYSLQTIKDNVQLLDEETIYKISEIIVKASHGLIKKKEDVACLNLQTKADSFPLSVNVHFPTDLNLLYDSARKSLDVIKHLKNNGFQLEGWKHFKKWYNILRSSYRVVSEIHRKKGPGYEVRLKKAVVIYLEKTRVLETKIKETLATAKVFISINKVSSKIEQLLLSLKTYLDLLTKHRDLIHRRLILEEKIPHSEKIFSIFEQHIEWLTKGKVNRAINLGHNVLIVTDQYSFILHAKVYEQETDSQVTIEIGENVHETYQKIGTNLASISFDRGFFSHVAKKKLKTLFEHVILPKPGYKSKAQKEEEEGEIFVKRRKAHSGVEANISMLQQHGLKLCRDQGIKGFKRYVAYGVLAYNLHQMGRVLKELDAQQSTTLAFRA